jgi:hypothetical protein
MKTSVRLLSAMLLISLPFAHAQAGRDRGEEPCISVKIQHDSVNTSKVRQSCDRNISRTVQVGKRNSAFTVQTGEVNNNKVRQYQYAPSEYLDRLKRR